MLYFFLVFVCLYCFCFGFVWDFMLRLYDFSDNDVVGLVWREISFWGCCIIMCYFLEFYVSYLFFVKFGIIRER